MLVAHDELDLAPGTARLKFDGGHGGQNGLRDIVAHLGDGKFHRLRIGIGHPGHKDRVTGWVLGRAGAKDEDAIMASIGAAFDVLPLALSGDFNEAMKRLHTAPAKRCSFSTAFSLSLVSYHSSPIPGQILQMGIKCGIVGLPNVGKSTLFNALTKAGIAAANFPFCTIDPNIGVVPVPDPRLGALADIVKPQKVIPTSMEFVDIAGLVAGASKGEGLGNKFPRAYPRSRRDRARRALLRARRHRARIAGKIDPISDIETIDTELALADLESVEKALNRVERAAKAE